MSEEYYIVLGPRSHTDDAMAWFIQDYVAKAVARYGLRVRGPYKVRRHTGEWIRVFDFSGDRKKDVSPFWAYVYNMDLKGRPAPGILKRERQTP